jgi:hypothetical protein
MLDQETPIISKQSIIKQLEENGVIKVDYKVKEYIDEALQNWWPGVFSITNYDDLTVFHYTDLIEDVITKYNRGV